jgi:hypothetical protein
MATLAQFSRNIRKRGSQIENAGTRFVKAVSKRSLRLLVEATPVDTGRARSNWRVGIGAPTSAVIQPYSPGKKLGIGERSNASAAIAAGLARINSVRGVSGVGLQTAIYINNNTAYIGNLPNGKGLNDGYSPQAPAGWIEEKLTEARSVLDNLQVFTSRDDDGDE